MSERDRGKERERDEWREVAWKKRNAVRERQAEDDREGKRYFFRSCQRG